MRLARSCFLLVATLAVGLGMLGAGPARAQGQPILVELFTSQGCSSCPPADALLGELAARDDVIALAYHVDYWDYLGWKDTFASRANTIRQTTYSEEVDRQYIGRRFMGIFTPEVVVQGTDSLIGSSRSTITARIEAHSALDPLADLSLQRDGTTLVVSVRPAQDDVPPARVMFATYLSEAKVGVKRGENAGRELTYHHVVKALRHATDWNGRDAINVTINDLEGPVVVFLQRGAAGPVLAAAQSDG